MGWGKVKNVRWYWHTADEVHGWGGVGGLIAFVVDREQHRMFSCLSEMNVTTGGGGSRVKA